MSARGPGQPDRPLGWLGILRLGLVQTALGAIVVLTTSTLNRVMVVELALPALLPGVLVGLHYAVQLSRPRWGYGADRGRRRVPWIVGGVAVLAAGAQLAALATAWMAAQPVAGIVLAVLAFLLIGGGVGAAGTSLLTLLATRVAPERRAPAATIVWVMMIAGFVVTATLAGRHLDPFTMTRLVAVTGAVCALALLVTCLAVRGLEPAGSTPAAPRLPAGEQGPGFRTVMREVWGEPTARRFALFVFASMLAYSAQDLILEPFAGLVFGLTPGESTRLAGVQHGGVLLGMILVGLAGAGIGGRRFGSLRSWTVGGCLASGAALFALALGGLGGGAVPGLAADWPLRLNVFLLGLANGAFAVAAIGSMMGLAGQGAGNREGVRMGLWGAAQAVAFGLGGFLGTLGVDLLRAGGASPLFAYSAVFALEGLLFVVAALMAARLAPVGHERRSRMTVAGDGYLAGVGGP